MPFNLMGLLMIFDFVSIIFSLICMYRDKHINGMLKCSIWIFVRNCKVKSNKRGIIWFLSVYGPEGLNFRTACYVQDMMINQNIFILSSDSGGKEINILDCNEHLSSVYSVVIGI